MVATKGAGMRTMTEQAPEERGDDARSDGPCGCVGAGGSVAGSSGDAPDPRTLGSAVRIAAGKARDVSDEVRMRLLLAAAGDDGMSTVEYAIGTIAAAAFGAVLYQVVTGDSIVSALTGIIDDALSTSV